MIREFALVLAAAFLVAWIAQVPAGAPPAGNHTCDAQSGCTLFYGTIAATDALATSSTKSYDYSCGAGPTTGTVNLTSGGFSDDTIFKTSGACNRAAFTGAVSGFTLTTSSVTGTVTIGDAVWGVGIAPGTVIASGSGSTWTLTLSATVSSEAMYSGPPVNVTKEYNQIVATTCAASDCDLGSKSGSAAVTAQYNYPSAGKTCVVTTGSSPTSLDSANTYTQSGQPQGLAFVGGAKNATASSVWFAIAKASFAPELQSSSSGGFATLAAGTALNTGTSYPTGYTPFAISGGASGASSNIEWKNTAGSSTGAGNAGTTTTAGKVSIGGSNQATEPVHCEDSFWDNNTAWNNANFAATFAAVYAKQAANWGL